MANKTTKANNPARPAATAEGSMEQVRELLFGEQTRRLEQRFTQLEQRLDELFTQLQGRLDNSGREQAQDSKQLRVELQEFRQDAENRLAAAEDQWSAQLGEADKSWRAELKALEDRLQHATTQLDQDKTGRRQLAELLNKMAVQLAPDAE